MAADIAMTDLGANDSDHGDRHENFQPVEDQGAWDQEFPNRPHNHSSTLPFHELFTTLFTPLNENKKKPTGPISQWRRKQGPHGAKVLSPSDQRRAIVERFISRWRKEVGNDIYPAFRLIVPDKDRDRPMYGLKEKTIGKLLVRVMRVDKNSEDGYNLLNWKLPGIKSASASAGDFAGRCFEVLQKRPMRTTLGKLTINEVNEMLDRLSAAQKEDNQLPIFEEFYKQMNSEEMMWVIRIILRYMKIGATERTIFELWHPDAENLFNVSSSLRRVCWELYDPGLRLEADDRGIKLMQCFQPQLAAFQMHSIERSVTRMNLTEEDPVFWIEEKLDGERMQLHMQQDPTIPGGRRFNFWSRKAKDYTYLYGNGFEDGNAALTRHIKSAFAPSVRNIILDGEMITWDPEQGAIVPFGTLKTAALSEQRNPFTTGHRPLFKVFDCLYLNDKPLTDYTLRDRRRALTSSVESVHQRLEVHEYTEGRNAGDIENSLRRVIEESSEGLVLKNPRSKYSLNERNDDWMKVKPEYMTEFGEALDCLIIGGYYGTGHRGGRLSSFLCGLRVDEPQIHLGANPQKFYSFFKVGGGFTAADYADVKHRTEGKWHDWDAKHPPSEYVELGGGDRQFERPDCWIKPEDSIVVEVKAASVTGSPQFRMNFTLRFPRFKKIRQDKDWKTALSIKEFHELRALAEKERTQKKFKLDDSKRKKRPAKSRKREIVLAGQHEKASEKTQSTSTKLFEVISFYVMTECLDPKTSKVDLEHLIKSNGGTIVQQEKDKKTVILADRNLVKVASLKKAGQRKLIRPTWIFDCLEQANIDTGRPRFLLPYEPRHLYFGKEDDVEQAQANVDDFTDSYTRDVNAKNLKQIMAAMVMPEDKVEMEEIAAILGCEEDLPGIFRGCHVYVLNEVEDLVGRTSWLLKFGRATISSSLVDDSDLTHVVMINPEQDEMRHIKKAMAMRARMPRLVTADWVESSFRSRTRLDEERFDVRV